MSAAAPLPAPPMTADELFDLPEDHLRHELVRGVLRTMTPAGFRHGVIAARVAAALQAFAAEHQLGVVVGAETGFHIERDPDTVRAPDAAFVRADRVPPPGEDAGFADLAPDLVVEVVSPSDRLTEVNQKAVMWLEAGARLVWVIDPQSRLVAVHRSDGMGELLSGHLELGGEDVLPGFRLPLAELFG